MITAVKDNVKLILKLARNDLKSRYSGSAFGLIWAYVQPLVTILVFWYVFQVGFKNPPVENVEYILWFVAGYIPWTFFNDGIMSSANVFYEYSYLVKKMKFKIWQLPIIKIFSSLFIHAFFLVFILAIYLLYGHRPTWAWLSIFYYSFCIMALLVGLTYMVSALSVFLKDNTQLVNVIMQIGFWLTPIFWAESAMTDGVLRVLQKNPMYYIVMGYRDAMIDGIGFWREPLSATLYFWIVTILIGVLGISVYKKLKDHFADLI